MGFLDIFKSPIIPLMPFPVPNPVGIAITLAENDGDPKSLLTENYTSADSVGLIRNIISNKGDPSKIGSEIKDDVGGFGEDIENVVKAVISFTELSINIIKEVVGLFPLLARLLKNIVPLIQNSANLIQTLVVIAPLLLIFLSVSYFIGEVESVSRSH